MQNDFDNTDEFPDYSAEPEVYFSPLSAQRYGEFYDVEMTNFADDVQFYLDSVKSGMNILEAGCGTGRLSHALASGGLRVTGIDISPEMLARASLKWDKKVTYICMDIREIALRRRFDAAIIAYNTLNLLATPSDVKRTLACIRKHMKENGLLLLQIFIPQKDSIASGSARTFQFQIFDTPSGGKIIKETLKSFTEGQPYIAFEERYRIRPMNKTDKNEDLAHTMNLLALSYNEWIELITEAGFRIVGQYGDFNLTPFSESEDSTLLLKAEAKTSS